MPRTTPLSVALVLAALCTTTASRADLATDWLAGKVAPPKVTYSGASIEAKYSHPSPPASVFTPLVQGNLKRLEVATQGKLQIKEYGSGSLFGAKDGFKGVRTGVAEWAACFANYEGRGMPLSRVWELPFVSPANPMVGVRVAQELAPKYFAPEFKRQGVVWGAFLSFKPADILSKKPIRRLEDLQGLKVGAQGFSPEAAKALGIALVSVPYPDLYTALEQGIIDAVLWNDAGFVPFRLYEVAKFHTSLGLAGSGAWTCYNPDWYAKLPADIQKAFYDGIEPFAMAAIKVAQIDYQGKADDAYKKANVEMIKLAPAELGRFRAKLQPVVDAWADDQEKEKRPGKQLLKDIQELSKKYEAMSPDELMTQSIEHTVRGIQ